MLPRAVATVAAAAAAVVVAVVAAVAAAAAAAAAVAMQRWWHISTLQRPSDRPVCLSTEHRPTAPDDSSGHLSVTPRRGDRRPTRSARLGSARLGSALPDLTRSGCSAIPEACCG